jgi:hypothetical protein
MTKRKTDTQKRRNNRNNYSRKGGMSSRLLKVPINRTFTLSRLNKYEPFEFLNVPNGSSRTLTKDETKIIKDGIELIELGFKKCEKSSMLQPGWDEKFKTMVIDMYAQAIITMQGGAPVPIATESSNALVKPKFSAFNYLNLLISIVFGVVAIIFMAATFSTLQSLINFDIAAIIASRPISLEMQKILCDAFKTGMETEGMNAMARIWYALSCAIAPMRPESVTHYETKIINIIQNVITNLLITTAKESTDLCVGKNKNAFLDFATKFSGIFTQAGSCMAEMATVSTEHKMHEIQYITKAVKTSFMQQGYSLYVLPTLMFVSYKMCDNYRLKYVEAAKMHSIELAKYENALSGAVAVFKKRSQSRGKIRPHITESP